MNRTILLLAICVLVISAVKSFEYEDDETLYDDKSESDESKPPIYDLRQARQLFDKFVIDYHKDYKDKAEYEKRYKIFESNLKYINDINREGQSESDINMFTDLQDEEIP
ncbi:unnamed protein product, partial [Brenthis ino]